MEETIIKLTKENQVQRKLTTVIDSRNNNGEIDNGKNVMIPGCLIAQPNNIQKPNEFSIENLSKTSEMECNRTRRGLKIPGVILKK